MCHSSSHSLNLCHLKFTPLLTPQAKHCYQESCQKRQWFFQNGGWGTQTHGFFMFFQHSSYSSCGWLGTPQSIRFGASCRFPGARSRDRVHQFWHTRAHTHSQADTYGHLTHIPRIFMYFRIVFWIGIPFSPTQHAVQHSSSDPCWPISSGRNSIEVIRVVSDSMGKLQCTCGYEPKPPFMSRTHAILIMHPLATRDAARIFVATHATRTSNMCYRQCSSTQRRDFTHMVFSWYVFWNGVWVCSCYLMGNMMIGPWNWYRYPWL